MDIEIENIDENGVWFCGVSDDLAESLVERIKDDCSRRNSGDLLVERFGDEIIVEWPEQWWDNSRKDRAPAPQAGLMKWLQSDVGLDYDDAKNICGA